MIKVLIVEDDPMVAQLNRRYLERIDGFELTAVVKTGDQALQVLEKTPVDLVLLDIFMPGMNGIELLSEIRRANYSLDVILVTAANDRQTIQKTLRYGAFDYLIKPFEFERLNEALQAYKKHYHLLNGHLCLEQSMLDQQVLFKAKDALPELEPIKGIDRNTLQLVWEKVIQTEGYFSTEDIAKAVGISRVSMRKYLDFLKRLNLLKQDLDYGSIGRPTCKYRCLDKQAKLLYR